MSKKMPVNCTCGSAFDAQGVCTSCGKKRPRSGGYHFLQTTLCAIGILILWFCFVNTTAIRSYIASPALTEAMHSARLSDADLPFISKNLSEYIRSNYVSDENVLPEDVAAATDGMGIPVFLADKLNAHFAMLRGDSDTPVRIETTEITDLLDQITESLRESCKLVIDDSDRQQIHTAVAPILTQLNTVSDTLGSTKAGRAFQRFGITIWGYILEVILLGLLIWRWCVVRKNSGKDIPGAFKGVGITIMIPAALSFLCVLIGGIKTFFIRDDVIGLFGVTKVLRGPFWFITITGISFALLMLELAAFLRAKKLYKDSVAAKSDTKTQSRQTNNAPVIVPVYRVPCVKCGKELETSAKFCKYCGANQAMDVKNADTAPEDSVIHLESPDVHDSAEI